MTDIPDTETGASTTPAAEVEVSDALVRALLEDQAPSFAGEPISLVATGWDNFTFKLGTDYAVRLPRREIGATLIQREQIWLPILEAQLPLPTPTPVMAGMPSADYPWPWSIVPWLSGQAADEAEPANNQAAVFVNFLHALHVDAPPDAPLNPVRGVPLETRASGVEERLRRLEQKTEVVTPKLLTIWEEALAAPLTKTRKWLHGDLHARNVLTKDGQISGIIDWGDITAGDVATDLAGIWALFGDQHARASAMKLYDTDEATWARARGWAILFGAVLLDTGLADTPRHAVMGERILRRVTEDSGV